MPERARHDGQFGGLVDTVEVLSDARIRVRFGSRSGPYAAGEPLVSWRLELVLEEGRWLVDRTSELPPIETVRLPAPVQAPIGDNPPRRLLD